MRRGLALLLCSIVVLPVASAHAQGSRPASPHPCRQLRYCVRLGPGSPQAGFAQMLVTGPIASPPRAESRGANQPGRAPAASGKFVEVSLNQGVGFNMAFSKWAAAGPAGQPADIFVDEMNEAGHPVSTRHLVKCRAATYQGVPNLDAGSATATIAHVKLRCDA